MELFRDHLERKIWKEVERPVCWREPEVDPDSGSSEVLVSWVCEDHFP